MIHSILIANRGEIASRIIRSCKKMGIRSVAIFSEADRDALFVQEADTAVYIGKSNPQASYLNQEKILDICKQHQIDALHPGYGFLSENATFARKCQEAGITFIGPHPKAIEEMGSKSNAKAIMKAHEVPVIPGYQGEDQSVATLTKAAEEIGFPVLLKATAGGGGKGMRIVQKPEEVAQAIEAAKREAQNAFGDDELIIEKYIASGRHIEFQILGDQHGNTLHILERECTIQRRYQKVIEESPSPALTPELRTQMGKAAVKAAKALQYDNAGTVEFIFDDQSQQFYFLEVNTRLQVEHPVTEEVTGLDLVQLQIQVAEGNPLTIKQEDIQSKGYAVECRLYAEDARNDFLPVTGTIQQWKTPEVEGLRIETAIQSGAQISMFYDPMIAKIIVWDQDRMVAHRKMHYTLRNLLCLGITTNQDFLAQLFATPAINQGQYDTHYLANHFDYGLLQNTNQAANYPAGIAAALYDWQQRESKRSVLKHLPSGWRSNFYEHQKVNYDIEGQEEELSIQYRHIGQQQFEFIKPVADHSSSNGEEKPSIEKSRVKLIDTPPNQVSFELDGVRYLFHIAKNQPHYFLRNEKLGGFTFALKDRLPEKEVEKVKGGYEAPMPSQIIKVLVSQGQSVKSGEGLVVLSSMKMENTITADEDGVVEEVYIEDGQNIEAGVLLLSVKSTVGSS
ncbi:MAG TPA: hypothetical protein DCS93_01075 [Microscillaceae bacterium]|nr:hypothetical protein [Microscillaceae bacterium]